MIRLFGFLTCLLLASCGAIQYDLFVNEDGSGRQTVFIDAGQMIAEMKEVVNDGFMDSLGMDAFSDWGTDTLEGTWDDTDTSVYDYMEDFSEDYDTSDFEEMEYSYGDQDTSMEYENMDEMWQDDTMYEQEPGEPDYVGDALSILDSQDKVDTTMILYDLIPDSVKTLHNNIALLKKISFKILADKEKDVMQISMISDFDNSSQLQEMMELLNEVSPNAGGMDGMPMGNSLFELNKDVGYLKIPAYTLPSEYESMGGEGEDLTEESVQMMLSMFGLDKIEVKYHLPGSFLRSEGMDVTQIDDTTVKLNLDFFKMFKDGGLPECLIFYKKK